MITGSSLVIPCSSEKKLYPIQSLKDDINTLYADIQGNVADAPPIRLELPDKDDTNQQWIKLVIDFADNRKGVVPSGYLTGLDPEGMGIGDIDGN